MNGRVAIPGELDDVLANISADRMPGSVNVLPMIALKDDHNGRLCYTCTGTSVPTVASARWPEPWPEEAL